MSEPAINNRNKERETITVDKDDLLELLIAAHVVSCVENADYSRRLRTVLNTRVEKFDYLLDVEG